MISLGAGDEAISLVFGWSACVENSIVVVCKLYRFANLLVLWP